MTDVAAKRHLGLKVAAVNVAALAAILLLFEGGVRSFITYNPSYYAAIPAVGSCIPHPYGEVCMNSHGFPDDEFVLSSSKPRVGYFGDSVCYGVGAGRGYRMTDLLKTHYQDYGHFNFCNIGDNPLSEPTMQRLKKVADEYKLSYVVYLMNLNDVPLLIGELETPAGTSQGVRAEHKHPRKFAIVADVKRILTPLDNLLRGNSYLYTFIRNKVKERLTVAAYDTSGYETIELFPTANREVLDYAAAKMNGLARDLRSRGIKLIVILLPYEMQISTHAADTYRRLNIRWEPGFESDSAQRVIVSSLDPNLHYVDVYYAFDGRREKAAVGEYFVYDKGDKIDWNHPNRAGHRLIADYLIREHFLP